jgi:hypothetical protein
MSRVFAQDGVTALVTLLRVAIWLPVTAARYFPDAPSQSLDAGTRAGTP